FQQRADPQRREELEAGHIDDDALLRRGGEFFKFARDRFGAREVEAAQDDDLAQVVADVGMTDGHDTSLDASDGPRTEMDFCVFPALWKAALQARITAVPGVPRNVQG